MRKYYSHISRRMSTELKICILLFIISVRWKLFFGVLKKKWNICFYYSGEGEKGSYRTLNRFVYMYTRAHKYTCNGEYLYFLTFPSSPDYSIAQWWERLPAILKVDGSNPSHFNFFVCLFQNTCKVQCPVSIRFWKIYL